MLSKAYTIVIIIKKNLISYYGCVMRKQCHVCDPDNASL